MHAAKGEVDQHGAPASTVKKHSGGGWACEPPMAPPLVAGEGPGSSISGWGWAGVEPLSCSKAREWGRERVAAPPCARASRPTSRAASHAVQSMLERRTRRCSGIAPSITRRVSVQVYEATARRHRRSCLQTIDQGRTRCEMLYLYHDLHEKRAGTSYASRSFRQAAGPVPRLLVPQPLRHAAARCGTLSPGLLLHRRCLAAHAARCFCCCCLGWKATFKEVWDICKSSVPQEARRVLVRTSRRPCRLKPACGAAAASPQLLLDLRACVRFLKCINA